ncbi:hypothetical protein NDU88_006178 [Pleurodeles waltl]|uniref:Uncharacterized protein n=1 Tax=Pleurodeles waltl TaxID=8319 RepID=A0AAV7MLK2_PLEWA|nr:hypothetical protein NDU88_006178 [Pleurodeles waltl]
MESWGARVAMGGKEIVPSSPLVCSAYDRPGRRASSEDLNVLCRLLLRSRGSAVCSTAAPCAALLSLGSAPPARPSLSERKGLGPVARSWLPSRPHCVSRLQTGAQRLSGGVSPCTVCFLTISVPPSPPVFAVTRSSRIRRPSFFVARPCPQYYIF